MATVLVIAGGDISRKLPFLKAGCACPALIPLNTRPLAAYVMDAYGRGHDLHLFVDERFTDEVRRELSPRKHGFTLHGVQPGPGVVDTLRQALEKVSAVGEVIVNLVTTIPVEIPASGEVQGGVLPAHSTSEWSAIAWREDAMTFHAKGEARPDDALAFTGVFNLPSTILAQAVATAARPNDLLSVIEAAAPRTPLTLRSTTWIDCGHETNYYRSRASLVNSRSFNRLRVDTRRGTITKSSSDKEKLSREAAYLETLPAGLRVLFPRLVSVSANAGEVESYEMEYYGYPNLAEYLLYWDLSKESWWRCFDSLHDTLDLFRAHPASIGPAAYRQFHWDKTVSRIGTYLRSLSDASLRDALENQNVTLNGRMLPPLRTMLASAGEVIESAYRESAFGIFHGDFCFNNILFDVASGVVRLIDPRGSFGASCPGIHGDWRYDLAKLSHSAIGHYDYIVNGLFDVWRDASGFHLEIGLRPNAPWLAEMTRWLIAVQKADPREIEVMTALLFLSMCPLHADDADRQLAFFLRGLDLLSQALA
ncbi:hypothetical protein KBB96_15350 [Luteolibacter ambystomatis]|uniref:Aminoglycoside phosphotransferase domain-containing protein n=1 Tax=Luteolibacter ambystomatis TaxID=2824561 RepID=A0A975G7L9_9BACT|nr:hypothetical protein [Luteolibacter ambystomatis]QUE50240.1 hypothetical protein KBB96_15350 [Luteolibacter ambystomatis]